MLAAAVSLAGCSTTSAIAGHDGTDATPTAPATSAAPRPTPTTPTQPRSAESSPSAAVPTAAQTRSSMPASHARSSSSSTFRSGTCTTAQLAGSVRSSSGGAAGSSEISLILQNTSSASCTLQGWPGVSYVGHGNGTQIGAAAQQDRTAGHPTVTIPAHQTGVVPLRVANAANYPTGTCRPVAADGFRVYPPGSRASLFIKAAGSTACANAHVDLLTVSAVLPRK